MGIISKTGTVPTIQGQITAEVPTPTYSGKTDPSDPEVSKNKNTGNGPGAGGAGLTAGQVAAACGGITVVNEVFTAMTSDQAYVVPSGVTSLLFKCWGAGGGGASSVTPPGTWHNGGPGGYAEGVLAVTPGETLIVVVGDGGAEITANNDGAFLTPANAYFNGGGSTRGAFGAGGGLTGIFRTSKSIGNAEIIAGAVGGSATNKFGGGAMDLTASSADAKVSFPSSSDWAFANQFTIEMWMY